MNIIVIGAEGQVGHFLMQHLEGKHTVLGTAAVTTGVFEGLDITDRKKVDAKIEEVKPDHVILTAALTNVDQCEQEPENAYEINVTGALNIGGACKRHHCGLTFFSTEYVFDGSKGPYGEDDDPNPLSVYGKTKLEAEHLLMKLLDDLLIIRTTVVYSYLPGSLNFFMQLYNRLKSGEPIRVVDDQIGNPTHAYNLAGAAVELIEKRIRGIYHLVGKTRIGRDVFARAVIDKLGYNGHSITTVNTAALKQQAPRPLNAGLKTDKADSVLKVHPLWELDQALDFTKQQIRPAE